VLLFYGAEDLYEVPTGSSRTEAPNGVGKKCVFVSSRRSLRLRRLTAENLCPSATVVRVHDGSLALVTVIVKK